MNPSTSASTKLWSHCSIQVIRQRPTRGEWACRAAFGLARRTAAFGFGLVACALGFFPPTLPFGVLTGLAAVPFSIVGLSPFKRRRSCSTRVRPGAARRERAGRLVPLVDPRRLLPPQHAGDDLRDPLGARRRRP